jgi:enoyl-CoA hydratase/carnithine racemase
MAEAEFETIQLDQKGPIGILTLNRPDKLNAISPQMKLDVGAALDRVESDDDIRVLVLRGAGRAFCAGFDLEGEEEGGVAHWREELARDFDVIMRFWQLKKPTISAIHKYASRATTSSTPARRRLSASSIAWCRPARSSRRPWPSRAISRWWIRSRCR